MFASASTSDISPDHTGLEPTEQVYDRALVPAPAAAGEHTAGIELVGNGAEIEDAA
jgi:hypothetical protein